MVYEAVYCIYMRSLHLAFPYVSIINFSRSFRYDYRIICHVLNLRLGHPGHPTPLRSSLILFLMG